MFIYEVDLNIFTFIAFLSGFLETIGYANSTCKVFFKHAAEHKIQSPNAIFRARCIHIHYTLHPYQVLGGFALGLPIMKLVEKSF